MEKPIGHKTYLKKLEALSRVLRTHDSTPSSLVSIERSPMYTVLLDEIRGHLDGFCKTCCQEDEQYHEGESIPEEECAVLGLGLDWLRPIYQCRRTAEILAEQTRLTGAIRAVAAKYHATLPLNEIEQLRGNDLLNALNSSLNRIWSAVVAREQASPLTPRTRLVL
jgi:hypothetical protein